jgi:hypothetical protein
MRDANLIDEVRSPVNGEDAPEERAAIKAADLIRNRTGYRWVGIYRGRCAKRGSLVGV